MGKKILTNIVLSIFLLFISCNPIIRQLYGVNKNLTFESSDQYISFFEKSNKIGSDSLLYIDSANHFDFLNEIVSKKLATFYGTFINDSTELKKSSFLEENMGCMTRVLNEIKKSSGPISYNDIQDRSLLIPNNCFKKYKFKYLKGNKIFQLDNFSQKISVFLIYSSQLGTLFKKDFVIVQDYISQNKDHIQLFVISLDKCYNLK